GQPRTLANAFRSAVDKQPDVLANSYEALGDHVGELDRMYGQNVERMVAGIGEVDQLATDVNAGAPVSVDELADWASGQVGR
ncbi:MAG: type I-E CRISPR-associated protein Cas7/Cse4/CasC, partial [Planctomycetota bacterium]